MEYYYKADELGDPLISDEHVTAFGWASHQELEEIVAVTLRVNDFLSGIFLGIGVRLIDFKLEFGRLFTDDNVQIVLAEAISPDNAGCGTSRPTKSLTKIVLEGLGRRAGSLSDIARRLGVLPEMGTKYLETNTNRIDFE